MTWRGWEIGMTGDPVAKIQATLIHKYQWVRTKYALRVTGVYDTTTAAAVMEFQQRVGLPPTGIANWATQSRLGVLEVPSIKRITIFTVSGTVADMWTGYPADVARAMDTSVYYWQPVNYPAATFPMGPSARAGETELVRLLKLMKPGDPFVLVGYSQGAMVTSRVFRRIMSGDLQQYQSGLLAGVTFGNPLRQAHHTFPGGADPGGHGLDATCLTNTPDFWHDYAAPGDIYTCASGTDNEQANDDMTSVYKLVQADDVGSFFGKNTLVEQIAELGADPTTVMPLFKAITSGIGFISGQPPTAPHVEYHIRQVSPGVTYFDHAINYLRDVGRQYVRKVA